MLNIHCFLKQNGFQAIVFILLSCLQCTTVQFCLNEYNIPGNRSVPAGSKTIVLANFKKSTLGIPEAL